MARINGINKAVPRGIDKLTGSIYGAHPNQQVQDLMLMNDLNHHQQAEHFGNVADVAVVSGTAAAVTTPGGFRLFGQGLAESADSGMVVTAGLDGQRMSTTNEDAHTIAIGSNVFLQPDTHGPFTFSALFQFVNQITTTAAFIGFCGTASDALDPRVTGATTVLTLVDDDVAGLFFDSQLTDGDRWMVPHNKSNAAATIATTAAGVDTGKNVVLATYTLATVTVDKSGNLAWSLSDSTGNKSGGIAGALDADEEHAAVFYVESAGTAAIRDVDVYAVSLDYYHSLS
jgi:hypothetical protein|tara:strand:+ start:859 stop:1716 length:858 start_codon:yes stop_codon:yes gene_type:complete